MSPRRDPSVRVKVRILSAVDLARQAEVFVIETDPLLRSIELPDWDSDRGGHLLATPIVSTWEGCCIEAGHLARWLRRLNGGLA